MGQSIILGAKELWKTMSPSKRHFFVWLVLLEGVGRLHDFSTTDYTIMGCVPCALKRVKSLITCFSDAPIVETSGTNHCAASDGRP
jgi:hypothetical protein